MWSLISYEREVIDEEDVTLGVGLNAGGIELDYACSDLVALNAVNRVSLRISF